ncbi:2925_t:CDS:2 [Paraglomus occultum]|uniref:2925_t:CDS:1 n=1 Tax=Paraglomus occultum TaxID=144539 RepID=A0A9N9GQ75_9GLOM|nr:2925_t:CDS:2 [Paraglomus occultum]
MDPRAYGKFVAQYKEKYPKATEDEIYEEYLKTQQEQSRSKGWVICNSFEGELEETREFWLIEEQRGFHGVNRG